MAVIRINGKLEKALKITMWLKEKGYQHDVDYSWRLESSIDKIVFSCKDERIETIIALTWSSHV